MNCTGRSNLSIGSGPCLDHDSNLAARWFVGKSESIGTAVRDVPVFHGYNFGHNPQKKEVWKLAPRSQKTSVLIRVFMSLATALIMLLIKPKTEPDNEEPASSKYIEQSSDHKEEDSLCEV